LVIERDNCEACVIVTWIGDVSDGNHCPEVITRTYRATDACGNSTDCTQYITIDDETAPEVTCPAAIMVECIEDVPAANPMLVIGTDNCDAGVMVTWIGDVSDGKHCPEVITRTYRATDACGNSTDCTQYITIDDETAPEVTCPAAIMVECIEDVPAANPQLVIATDNCEAGVIVTWIGDVSDGNHCPEVITRTYRATDACGNSTDCTQYITIDDETAPEVTCPAAILVECIEDVPAANPQLVIASDNCAAGVMVTWIGDVSDGNHCPEVITRTYRATDACGNSTDCTQYITIDDETAPEVTCPAAIMVECI
jgi:hypothetical protein